MKKTIEVRFGDTSPFYVYAGEDIISLAEAHLKIFGWVREKRIFPVLSDEVIADRVLEEIKEGKYPVGELERAVAEFSTICVLWKNLTSFLIPLGDKEVAVFVVRRSTIFWSLMSMRFGLFFEKGFISRGFVVNTHDLLENLDAVDI